MVSVAAFGPGDLGSNSSWLTAFATGTTTYYTHLKPPPSMRNLAQKSCFHIICQCNTLSHVRHFHFQEFLLPLLPNPYIKQLTSYLDDSRIYSLESLSHD